MSLERRKLLSKVGLVTAGIAAVSLMPVVPETASAQMFGPPAYTMAERDRRWAVVREMMREQGLDVLIVPHGAGDNFHEYARYLSETFFMVPGAIMLPLEGEATGFGNRNFPGMGGWISNAAPRNDSLGSAILGKLEELDYSDKTIGVIGTEPGVFGLNEFAHDGLVLYSVWDTVLKGLPNATFKDVTTEMALAIMIKGEEEIRRYEEAALLGERLNELLLDTMKVGVDDRVIYAEIAAFFALNNARPNVEAMRLRGPIREGQVIASEYGINYRGGYKQVTLSIGFGNISEQAQQNAETAEAVCAHALETIMPGKTFGEVIDPLEKMVADAGARHGFPLIHSIGPLILVGPTGGIPGGYTQTRGADVVLKPGMMLSLECGARKSFEDEVRVGGSGVVTDDGFRIFNTLGLKFHRL